MYQSFMYSLTVALYAVGITLAWSVIVLCILICLNYFKHLRYYYAIYKHPEIFGNAKSIPWEVKKQLMGKMAKRTENAFNGLNPDKENCVSLKIYCPDEAESA